MEAGLQPYRFILQGTYLVARAEHFNEQTVRQFIDPKLHDSKEIKSIKNILKPNYWLCQALIKQVLIATQHRITVLDDVTLQTSRKHHQNYARKYLKPHIDMCFPELTESHVFHVKKLRHETFFSVVSLAHSKNANFTIHFLYVFDGSVYTVAM